MSGDSDSDEEDFCLFGMKGPIVVCEEDLIMDPIVTEADLQLSELQHLELSVLRKDIRAVKTMLAQDGGGELQRQTVEMALSFLEGSYVGMITATADELSFSHLCKLCNSYKSTLEVPENIRQIVFRDVAGKGGGESDGVSGSWKAFQALLLGSAFYSLFCQANYTGPKLSREDTMALYTAADVGTLTNVLSKVDGASVEETTGPDKEPSSSLGQRVPQYSDDQVEEQVDLSALNNKNVLKLLECDGNYAFPLCELPVLLVLARSILLALASPMRAGWQAGISLSSEGEVLAAHNDDVFDVNTIKTVRKLCSRQWMSSRVLLVHLRLLQKQSYIDNTTLFKEMQDMFEEAEAEMEAVVHKKVPVHLEGVAGSKERDTEDSGIILENAHLLPMLQLEHGLGNHFFDYADKGKALFQKAMQTLDFTATLTAAMGKRTKHQVHDHAQLLLISKSSILPTTSDYNLTSALADADAALTKAFGTKKGAPDVPASNEWEHSEWELGTRIVTTSEKLGGAEVAIRDVKLDSADGGAAENILLEEGVKFSENQMGDGNVVNIDSRHNVLHPVEQAMLLALCLDVSNSNPTGDCLTTEQMFPYLQAVLNMYHNHQHLVECDRKIKKKNEMLSFHSMGNEVDLIDFTYRKAPVEKCLNWMVYSTTLLERSFLEFEKRRTMDRAVMQIQALLDQHTTNLTVHQSSRQDVEEAAPAHVRLQLLPILVYPAHYEVKRDLAQRYLRCQIFNSALNLFTELEMWDEVVTCYQLLQKPRRAEMLVRERLEQGEETPYMVCALADLTQSEELYERAWVLR